MAEKEEKKDEAKPARSSKMLIIIVVAVLLAGAGGYFAMSKSGGAKEGAAEEVKSGGHGEAKGGHEKKGEAESKGSLIHPLDTFIVNLTDQGRTRYLKVTVQLEIGKQETVDLIKSKTPQIRDSLIILLSSKSIEEISTSEGKYQLRDEIVARVKQFAGEGAAVAAYFTDFVVQ